MFGPLTPFDFPIIVTLCYAIGLPGRKSDFRVGIRPDSNRESLEISLPAGRSLARGFPDKNPAEIQPGSQISGPEALLRNIWKGKPITGEGQISL